VIAVRPKEWTDAQRRCRLSDAALAMAKELGLAPHSLVKKIPNRSEPQKSLVEEWGRRLQDENSPIAAVDRIASAPPVSTGEIDDDARMLRRRDCFRGFAELFSVKWVHAPFSPHFRIRARPTATSPHAMPSHRENLDS
jgi:hypothetical protein